MSTLTRQSTLVITHYFNIGAFGWYCKKAIGPFGFRWLVPRNSRLYSNSGTYMWLDFALGNESILKLILQHKTSIVFLFLDWRWNDSLCHRQWWPPFTCWLVIGCSYCTIGNRNSLFLQPPKICDKELNRTGVHFIYVSGKFWVYFLLFDVLLTDQ